MNMEYVNRDRPCDLIYSEDEEGWYWQKQFGDCKVSSLYETAGEAVNAMSENKIEWIDAGA